MKAPDTVNLFHYISVHIYGTMALDWIIDNAESATGVYCLYSNVYIMVIDA